jgi:type IV pilus assembly protein PilV
MQLSQYKQQGVSLIESMIALLVISVGLLGIAALQITSMSQNSSALNHSQAVWIAYNISDRVRANDSQFAGYSGIDTGVDTDSQNCMSSACTNAQMLTADAEDLRNMVSNLPAGRGIITNNADGLVISIMWDDEGTGATGTNCGSNPDVDLTCYAVALTQ